eukprot:gene12758-17104_t
MLRIRGAYLSDRLVRIQGLGFALSFFDGATQSHLNSIVHTRQSKPPIIIPTLLIPFSISNSVATPAILHASASPSSYRLSFSIQTMAPLKLVLLFNFNLPSFKKAVLDSLAVSGISLINQIVDTDIPDLETSLNGLSVVNEPITVTQLQGEKYGICQRESLAVEIPIGSKIVNFDLIQSMTQHIHNAIRAVRLRTNIQRSGQDQNKSKPQPKTHPSNTAVTDSTNDIESTSTIPTNSNSRVDRPSPIEDEIINIALLFIPLNDHFNGTHGNHNNRIMKNNSKSSTPTSTRNNHNNYIKNPVISSYFRTPSFMFKHSIDEDTHDGIMISEKGNSQRSTRSLLHRMVNNNTHNNNDIISDNSTNSSPRNSFNGLSNLIGTTANSNNAPTNHSNNNDIEMVNFSSDVIKPISCSHVAVGIMTMNITIQHQATVNNPNNHQLTTDDAADFNTLVKITPLDLLILNENGQLFSSLEIFGLTPKNENETKNNEDKNNSPTSTISTIPNSNPEEDKKSNNNNNNNNNNPLFSAMFQSNGGDYHAEECVVCLTEPMSILLLPC